MPKRTDVTRAARAFTPRRMLLWVIILIFVWVVWSRFAEVDAPLKTLREGRPLWIGVALGLQMLYFVLFSGVYWSAFRTVDVGSSLLQLIPLTFASIFVNSTVTSGGAAGTVLFVDDA